MGTSRRTIPGRSSRRPVRVLRADIAREGVYAIQCSIRYHDGQECGGKRQSEVRGCEFTMG